MTIEAYKNRAGKWQLRIVARNGEKWVGGQAYASKSNAKRAARTFVKRAADGIQITVVD